MISKDFGLPLDAQTGTLVVYGGKGMGKTNFGSVLVEELAQRGLRFSVIDPLDVWWGLQYAQDKNGRGIEVLILGGPHGNLPIHPGAGAIVADFVADETVSTVVVLRHANGEMWSNGERIRFVTDYFTRLYMRQGEHRRPLMQIVDEAGRFVPQMAAKGDVEIAKCIGAIEQMVEWGRNVGVGVCLITQRSARMNKSVSELADCMIAFRTVGPNSIEAIVDWLGEHIPKSEQKDWISQIRSLERGSALLVSPGWLSFEGVVKIRARQTFDSSATPKPGQSLRAPGKAVKPDLAKYSERMTETIEEAKANDPKELKKQIYALQKDLKDLRAKAPAPAADQVDIQSQIDAATTPLVRRIDQMETVNREALLVVKDMISVHEQLLEYSQRLGSILRLEEFVASETKKSVEVDRVSRSIVEGAYSVPPTPASIPKAATPVVSSEPPEGFTLKGKQQAILDAIAWWQSIGVTPSGIQVGAVAIIDATGGYFSNLVGPLVTAGHVIRANGKLGLTDTGRALCSGLPETPTLAAYHDMLRIRAKGMKSASGKTVAILDVMIDAQGESLTTEEIGRRIGVDHTGGYFSNCIGPLSTMTLIERGGGVVRPTPLLFPEGLR